MSAKATDLARIQEMFDLITETQGQIERLGITEERFKRPATDADRLFSEAIMNRVLRVTEEAGSLSDEALAHYEFERRAIKGVRNRLAHAYGRHRYCLGCGARGLSQVARRLSGVLR